MSHKIKKRPSSALKRPPLHPERALQEGLALHRDGRLDEAKALYRRILESHPRHTDALNLLATLCQQQGDFRRAIALLHKAISLQPGRADYYSNLGSAERSAGELGQAILSFRKALALQPGHLESQFNLGLCHLEQKDFAAATQLFRRILESKPAFLPAHEMLGQSLLGQDLLPEALACFRKMADLAPQQSTAFCEIGNILQSQGQLAEAVSAYQEAIALSPNFAVAHNNLGNTLVKQGNLHAAMAAYQEALRCNPDLTEATVNLGWTYKEHGMIQEDISFLTRYLARHPEQYKVHSDLLFTMNYDPAYSPAQHYAAAQSWWQRHAPRPDTPFPHPPRQPEQKLRIGFLSPDFRDHPVGTFLLPLFTAIDQQEASLHCYTEIRDRQMDAVSHRLRGLASSWFCTAGLSAVEAATRIHHDGLDILIDLAGHSAYNRLDIMALQSAPCQASWLGYVNTSGLPVIDYRLSDAIADPPGAEAHYSEALYRLPDAFFCYEPPALAPEVGELPALARGRITFGSLNNPSKITGEVIASWSEILLRAPDSRLILVGKAFADEFIRDRYLAQFAANGVAPERLSTISSLPMAEYLKLYNTIDIALDPFPHNGHTITCHTLWMGVPVITLAGNRYAARMGASVLTGIGLPELIARTPAEYLTLATSLADDLDKLSTLRRSMRDRMLQSAICDTPRFAKNFLSAMRTLRKK